MDLNRRSLSIIWWDAKSVDRSIDFRSNKIPSLPFPIQRIGRNFIPYLSNCGCCCYFSIRFSNIRSHLFVFYRAPIGLWADYSVRRRAAMTDFKREWLCVETLAVTWPTLAAITTSRPPSGHVRRIRRVRRPPPPPHPIDRQGKKVKFLSISFFFVSFSSFHWQSMTRYSDAVQSVRRWRRKKRRRRRRRRRGNRQTRGERTERRFDPIGRRIGRGPSRSPFGKTASRRDQFGADRSDVSSRRFSLISFSTLHPSTIKKNRKREQATLFDWICQLIL